MSYNQKPPGPGGSGMGGGIPPNGPNNQQVAKTLAGIQQQMQNLVHGQNALPQSSQAELNVFFQQQRFQNMLKQQQLLHFQMQQQQHQQQQHQQQQQKDRGGGGVGIGGGGGGGVGGEPLALTRTPAAAELLNKTFQQHQQQQPNGSAAAPNAALNQFQQQLQALPPNLIQQLQNLSYQMQQHQQQQHQQHQHQQHQAQQHPGQPPQTQHHPTHQQPPPPPPPQQQQQPQPQPLLTAHQQQQLHGQIQQQQQKALQQFQQSLRYFPTSAPTQPSVAPQTAAAGNKGGSGAAQLTQQPPIQTPPSQPPSSTLIGNQLKSPNLPPSTQITPVSGNVGMIPGSIAQQAGKTTVGSASLTTPTSAAMSTAGGGSNTAPIGGAKQTPTPSISLLPAKAGTSTAVPSAAHQQSKFGAGKTSPVVSAIPPPFPTHFQKPSAVVSTGNTTGTTNITSTAKTGAVPTAAAAMTSGASNTVVLNKSPQQSVNPVPLTKQATSVQSQMPAAQVNAVASTATTSTTLSTAAVATLANSGAIGNDAAKQIKETPKASNSISSANSAGSLNTMEAPADRNVKTDTKEAVKSASTTSDTVCKAKDEQHATIETAKPTQLEAKTEKNIDAAASKDTNVDATNKIKKPGDGEESVPEKTNTTSEITATSVDAADDGADIKKLHGSDVEQTKLHDAKEREGNSNIELKEDLDTKANELKTNAHKSESTSVATTNDENKITATEVQDQKSAKNEDKNIKSQNSVTDEKEGEGNDENKVNDTPKDTEKTDMTKTNPEDEVAKNASVTTSASSKKPIITDKKESLNTTNDSKTVVSTPIAIEAKSKATAVPSDENKSVAKVAEKPKEEKKNTKLEKPLAITTTSTSADNSTHTSSGNSGNINHTNTKSTKSKVETAPDSTNSSVLDVALATPVKRSSRQPKIVTKSTEKATIEKSEKVTSSSRSSRKSKSGSSSSASTTVAEIPASPMTPKPSCEQGPSTSASDRKSSRHRLKTIPFQSPLPELAYITKLSASEASNSPKPMSIEDKLIVFYKNEYMAVRNAEGTFYLCQTMQNVYRTSPRISIRWLSEDPNNIGIYIPDFYDHTDIECVLTTVELKRVDKGHLSLPKKEQARIESILKKAIDVEKGLVPRPELTEENPDGLDISLYKDESQIEKKLAMGATPTTTRKSRRSGNEIGTTTTGRTSAGGSSANSSSKGRKRGRGKTVGTSDGDNGVKSSAKKRKTVAKRKTKSKKTTTTDEESSDDSDAEYKPNQKNANAASKSSPRAQRSPLAKARAASPISSTTARTKIVTAKPISSASSRGERANKRKAAADGDFAESTPTSVKKTGGVTTPAAVATAPTPNASKSSNATKTQDGTSSEANNSGSGVKKAATAGDASNMVTSTTNVANSTTTIADSNNTGASSTSSSSGGGSNGSNRPTRSRK